jgi:hypothetical protein
VQKTLAGTEGVEIVAAMPGSVELLAAVRGHLELSIPLLSDPAWDFHRRYGLRRGTRRDIFLSVSTWKAYARLFRRWQLRRPSEDVFQLGGVAVVDGDGDVAWLHRGRNPADYADPDEVGRVIRALLAGVRLVELEGDDPALPDERDQPGHPRAAERG